MRLIIKNFASLKNINIVIDDFTVIIGEQASGKSLTSKVYFFLMDVVSSKIGDSISEKSTLKTLQHRLKKDFTTLFPEYSWRDTSFEIAAKGVIVSDEEIDITISYSPGSNGVRFSFSDRFKQGYKTLSTTFSNFVKEAESEKSKEQNNQFYAEFSTYRLMRKAIIKTKSGYLAHDVIYIPSGRSFFSTIKENVFGFLSENIGIDPFLKNFGRYYEFSKSQLKYFGAKASKDVDRFDAISETIVKGKFSADKKEEWIISGNRKIALTNASSGQQEALPLILVLRSEFFSSPESGYRSIVVEEPEAHLFPVSQRAVVDLLFQAKKKTPETKFIVTSHSPYILSCINNEIIKSKGSVNVSAYFISNGISTLISDKDSNLINGSDLDKVSSEISDEFYKAMESLN